MFDEYLSDSYSFLKEAKDRYRCEKIIVLMSAGKDSVCLFDVAYRVCQTLDIECYFAHHYFIKGLEIDEEVLQNLEDRYKVTIDRFENSMPKMILMQDGLCINLADNEKTREMPVTKYKIDIEVDRALMRRAKTKWMTMGIKKADSVNRRYALNEYPNPNPRKKRIYPLANWKNKTVQEYIEHRKLPLSRIYSVAKRSLESFDIESIYPLKFLSPRDYDRICNRYPLIDAMCWVYEKRAREFGQENLPRC